MTRFDLVYLGLSPLAVPLLLYKRVRYGKYRESMPGMFGRGIDREPREPWKNGCVWVHAVSVGEVLAAKAMLQPLRQKFPDLPILLTTVTETGQAQARSLPEGLVDAVRFYPADFSWVVQRFIEIYKPKVFIPMETELWPNALQMLGESGVKIFVLNGKISEKSGRQYMRVREILHKPLSQITAFCMQTEKDAERIVALTGTKKNVFVTGNCKFDIPYESLSPFRSGELRKQCGIATAEPVIVAGSTHPGEEEIVLNEFKRVLEQQPAVLAVVPRHPERFDEAWRIVSASGLPALRLNTRERTMPDEPPRVVLIDRMGLLSELYGIATLSLVCGSFVPGIGGHNLLEAAAHSVPVLFGPFADKQPDMVRILTNHGGFQVAPEKLGATMLHLLQNEGLRRGQGEKAREAVMQNRGSAQRNIEMISRYI